MLHGMLALLEKRRAAPIGDRGIVVGIVSWILLVATVFTLLTRMAMKMALLRKGNRFGLDDLFIVLAALFSIGQTIAVSVEAVHVLGQHIGDNPGKMKILEQTEYAGCMLYIANMGCARISLCLLIKKILPGAAAGYTALAFAGLTALWTLSGVLVTAFPCSLPNPWQFQTGKNCIDPVKFINYVGTTNIIVEVLLVIIPLFVWNLRLSAGRRASVSSTFVARLSIVATVATQLSFLNRPQSVDITYDYWRIVLCVQIAQNLSVITACLPCLHPFVLSVLSGATETDRLVFECQAKRGIKNFFRNRKYESDSTSSQSSSQPIKEATDMEYCRPLNTWGLDRSSAQLNSQHSNRFPNNTATPIGDPHPPENVFNRIVEFPRSRPETSGSKDLPPIPKNLSEVGVLPIIDWDTDSDRDGRSSAGSRQPDSQYVFNRAKVISVPEDDMLYKEDYWRQYPPPPVSPGLPKRPRKM